MQNIWMLLQQTMAASLTALFLLALQRLFRDKLSPKWRYTVWLVLLCRLAIPVGLSRGTVLDLSEWISTLRIETELSLTSAWSGPWQVSLPFAPIPWLPAGGAPQSVTDWLFVAYLAGMVVCGVWLALGWRRLRKLVRQAAPITGARWSRVKELAQSFGLNAPERMVESAQVHGPFLMGAFRPVLVVPMGWQVEEKVVLHELLHLKNHDVAAGWITTLFRCIHWCNPFLWWVLDRIDNQREERCDQQVLERLEGEERRDYGRVLLSMAEDGAIRIPGATSMANGATRIKQRIQSIARFKTYPQGMGLVSVCISLLLVPYLVLGFPALAAEDGYVPLNSDAHALAYGQQNRCTTVAGALDAYAWWMYYRIQSPGEALRARAMICAEEDMAALWAENEATWDRWRADFETRHDEQLLAYRTGPVYRGLNQLEDDRWVCQVYMFRDQELEIGPIPDEIPIEFLCHTVEIKRQKDGAHTVRLLKEETGEFPGEFSLTWGEYPYWAEVPVRWTGTAAGVEVTVRPRQTMLIYAGWYNGWTRNMWQFLKANDWRRGRVPDRDANFSACYGGGTVQVTNHTGEPVEMKLTTQAGWEEKSDLFNYTVDDDSFSAVLAAGETAEEIINGGGIEFFQGLELEECLCPTQYTVTLTVDGVEYPMTLRREVSWE